MKFHKVQDLISQAEQKEVTIGQIVKELEAENQEISQQEVIQKMHSLWKVMEESALLGLSQPKKSMGGLIGGEGKKLDDYRLKGRFLAGDEINKAVSRALAVAEVNASMGKIVAAPTAGSCGILPGVLLTVQEKVKALDDDIINALFTASGIGIIIAQRASVSGAAGGCQAECGAAAGMAAAAAVELAGGSPTQAGNACAIALKNVLGLVCDPVAGLVEVPCAKRNALGASLALVAADMALAGIDSVIPVDEVIVAMGEVGRALPESLRETSRGGLAATPTGIKLKQEFIQKCKG
ncbi:MAG: L-serine ammonia-lyase, iron-sulfur-dependent, subunit alpha [Bacillota bacterium]